MIQSHIDEIKEKLSVLCNQKLEHFIRASSVADIGFGELIEKNIRAFDENKNIITKTITVPKYSLHIDCNFRLVCGNEIIVARGDIFQPSNKIVADPDFIYEEFNWDIIGNNRFDEIIKQYFIDGNMVFTVKKIVVNKFGDLKIYFENNFLLEVSSDISGNEECYRFFEQKSENHLVVSGIGIELED